MNIRSLELDLVLELWRDVSAEWAFAAPRIADVFRRVELTDEQKKEIVEALHEMIAQYRRLDFALESSGAQREDLRGGNRDRALYAAAQLLAGKIDSATAQRVYRGVDWDAVARVSERIAQIADPVRRFALEYSLPDELAKSLLDEYGPQAGALAGALNQRAPAALRANTLKNSREELLVALEAEAIPAKAAPLASAGLIAENPARLFSSKAFKAGLFEAQDEGSQLIAELCMPARGSKVLDACAGTGGKTLALSALMEASGTLLALDVSEAKLDELRRRARRAEAFNVRALRTKPDAFPREAEDLSGKFNRVLVDAPCGGSGALRRNPESRWRADRRSLQALPELQITLARRALNVCAKGGRVIYATCSLLRAENEAVAELLLNEGACEAVPLKEIIGKARAERIASPCGRFLKLLPHIHGTDGFFAVVLRKR